MSLSNLNMLNRSCKNEKKNTKEIQRTTELDWLKEWESSKEKRLKARKKDELIQTDKQVPWRLQISTNTMTTVTAVAAATTTTTQLNDYYYCCCFFIVIVRIPWIFTRYRSTFQQIYTFLDIHTFRPTYNHPFRSIPFYMQPKQPVSQSAKAVHFTESMLCE